MARPLRIELANGIYHVVARGNGRQEIYLDDFDRSEFLRVAGDVVSRHDWHCLTYSLLGNHYHLVVRTPRPDLSRGMRQLNGVYAQRFNRRHKRGGHLFGGRFRATFVDDDAYICELARYVALNPVRAGLCDSPEQWRWSGHRALLGRATDPLVGPELLSWFGSEIEDARRRYREFVGAPHQELDPTDSVVGTPERVASILATVTWSTDVPKGQRLAGRPPLAEVLSREDRDEAIAAAVREHGYLLREVADALGRHPATIGRWLRGFERRQRSLPA